MGLGCVGNYASWTCHLTRVAREGRRGIITSVLRVTWLSILFQFFFTLGSLPQTVPRAVLLLTRRQVQRVTVLLVESPRVPALLRGTLKAEAAAAVAPHAA